MAYQAKILCDAFAPSGRRLTTFVVTYPRMVHAELMTHRLFSRNSSSSRAIPIATMIEQVQRDPAGPVWWGKNQPGMQAREELADYALRSAREGWLAARDQAVRSAMALSEIGLHKQIANRLLEPWMWITVIVTATEYANFFKLRCHPDAQPEIAHIAHLMRALYEESEPISVPAGRWSTPFLTTDDAAEAIARWTAPDGSQHEAAEKLRLISAARCARVSYLTHEGTRDLAADVALAERLAQSGHWSPFEHIAQALDVPTRSGNFFGWRQYRKTCAGEHAGDAVDGS